MKNGVTALALALCALSSHAFSTGNDIHEAMRDPAMGVAVAVFVKSTIGGLVIGYEIAKTGEIGGMSAPEAMRSIGVCPSTGATIGQFQDVFAKYLTENPAKRNQGAGRLFVVAMQEAFPCPGWVKSK